MQTEVTLRERGEILRPPLRPGRNQKKGERGFYETRGFRLGKALLQEKGKEHVKDKENYLIAKIDPDNGSRNH